MSVATLLANFAEPGQLEDRLRLFSTAVEEAPDGIQITDLNGFVLYSNKAVKRIYGFSPEELQGKHVNEMNADPDFASQVIIPAIRATGKWAGDLLVKHKSGPNFPISLNTTLVLDDAATPIAILGIIRDITERKRVEELSIALNRINTTINSTLDFHRIMQRVVVEANNAMGSEAAWITLRDGDGWLIGHHSDPSSRLIGRRFADDEAHIACLVSRTRKSVTINDTCRYKLQNPRVIVEECGIRSLLAVPLRAKNDLVGVLIFVHHAAPVHFSDISADFAKKLGASISLALENARLYWAQRRIAETLQQSLIRPTPQVAGLEIGVAYSPAFEAEKVGGDFYDVFEVRKNVVAVLIGDVAGKGVDAAGLTETVRSSVRALAYINHAPSFVLDRANQTLLRQIPPDQFVTAAFLTIDTETGRTLYASAGHPSAVLCGKECGFLDSPSGLPLGTLNRSYSEAELHVQEMETLILYTDGLLEARRDHEIFGESRVLDTLLSAKCKQPQELTDSVLESARDFAKGCLGDDIAIVAIRRPGRRC